MTIESPDRVQNSKDGVELDKTLSHNPARIQDIYSPPKRPQPDDEPPNKEETA